MTRLPPPPFGPFPKFPRFFEWKPSLSRSHHFYAILYQLYLNMTNILNPPPMTDMLSRLQNVVTFSISDNYWTYLSFRISLKLLYLDNQNSYTSTIGWFTYELCGLPILLDVWIKTKIQPILYWFWFLVWVVVGSFSDAKMFVALNQLICIINQMIWKFSIWCHAIISSVLSLQVCLPRMQHEPL